MSEKFLDHPDFDKYIEENFFIMINESDRGAILLGSAYIENELKQSFKTLLPNDILDDKDDKDSKRLLKGSFDSRLNQAYLCRYIPYNLFKAINIIKAIRNKVSHNSISFKLEDNQTELDKVYNLVGKNMDLFIEHSVNHILYRVLISIMKKMKNPLKPDELAFINEKEISHYLSENKYLLGQIEDKKVKAELAFCTIIISRLISYHFDKALGILKNNKVISSIS